VSSAACKVLVPNAGFLLASMFSYCRFRPLECSYSQSVSVFVPQDRIRGSAIHISSLTFAAHDILQVAVLAANISRRGDVAGWDSNVHPAAIAGCPIFCRSEREHVHKGDVNSSAKYGMTASKDQTKLHPRLCPWKHLTGNRAVRELMKGGVPWLRRPERFGQNQVRKDFKVMQHVRPSCRGAGPRRDSD